MNGKQKRTYSEHEVGRDMIAVVVLEVLAKYSPNCPFHQRQVSCGPVHAGRFSHTRGRLGFMIARSFVNKPLFIRRCRDTALDGRGHIIPLADDDIITMLEMIATSCRPDVDLYLEQRFTTLLS